MHANSPIPRLAGDTSRLQALLDGLLAKRPQDRFPSAASIVAAIDALLEIAAA
jgi:hypothetical protein